MPKILAFAGSYRKHSFSKRVLTVAVEGAREAGADVTVLDLNDYPLPIFNEDDVNSDGFPENAYRLQDALNEADGFLISTPEYNASVPGGFKNAIDWASRANDRYKTYSVFKDRTAAIISSSTGRFGGIRGLGHLRGILTQMGIVVLPSEVSVSGVAEMFAGEGGEMTDERMRTTLKAHGAALVEALSRK